MANHLIRWSLAHRLPVLFMAGLLILAGVLVTVRMPVDVFPDLTAPTVTVVVEGHGISPREMETQVTFPIEAAVNGAPDVRRVRSGTAVGISVVWVEFEWGTDVYRARQTVAERLAAIAGSLPQEVEPPKLAPASSIMGEILFVSLTSPRHGLLELRTIAVTQIRRRLLAIAGVSQVTPIGGDTKQYQVLLSAERLRAYGLAPAEVARALAETNENVAAGVLVSGAQETIVEGIGRVRTPEDIGATVVALRGETPVRVSDLGRVAVGAAFKRGVGAASRRGPAWEPIIEPGVIIAIQKQPGTNTLEVTERLDAALDDKTAIWGDFDAQEVFQQLGGKLGIATVNVGFAAFFEEIGRVGLVEVNKGNTMVSISGTKVREQLVAGEKPDPRIMRPSTAKVLVDYYKSQR
jgi:Cu/Ag efflux pump CusA